MRQLFNNCKSWFNKPRNLLPQGVPEFESWAKDILFKAGLPDNDSTRFTLAVMVLHLPSEASRRPKQYFIGCLQKAAANQVVSQVINDLKAKQEAAQKAAAEVTAPTAADAPPAQT